MRSRPLALVFAAGLARAAPTAAAEPTVPECLSSSERGQNERDDGHYVRARASFATCSSNACPAVVRRDCTAWLLDLEAKMPTIVLVARDGNDVDRADVVVRMDGAVLASRLDGKPIAVDPGEHVFVFEAGGHRVERRAVVRVGERDRILQVTLDEPAPAAPPANAAPSRAVGALVLGGFGAASLGSSIVLWLGARSDLSSIESSPCAATKTCDPNTLRSIRTRLVVGDVMAGVGVAAIGAAVWLWVTRDRPVAASIGPTSLGRGPQLSVTSTF